MTFIKINSVHAGKARSQQRPVFLGVQRLHDKAAQENTRVALTLESAGDRGLRRSYTHIKAAGFGFAVADLEGILRV